MELKEIHLHGFKSFADKTVIRFDEGVTCIVGPNGCGKSNVADAVRWVLGEQSAKQLRGSNMQDVIFGGTVERKQSSFSEVTLVFDNTKRIFDVELDEVAMTRRLYRSGDSRYLLNGEPSRLKEFVRLFHGVGLGKEGYSIISQGKVEQIMNRRPAERREIFEEAAGLMNNKRRKEEIESKIAGAANDLAIYRQRLDEVERRLGPLAKQAEGAKLLLVFLDDLTCHITSGRGKAPKAERRLAQPLGEDAVSAKDILVLVCVSVAMAGDLHYRVGVDLLKLPKREIALVANF